MEEIFRVTRNGGVFCLMTHVVSPKREAVFRLFHSSQHIKQFLFPLTRNGNPNKIFHGMLGILRMIYREYFYGIFMDGYLHPHYFNYLEVNKKLLKTGYSVIKENITTDMWKFKLGAYYVCLKP
jgi:hypothetical protein